MIIETGFRCHITQFNRATAPAPSGFVTRLRKYLKSRRVTSVTQVGTDRIIEIQFSDGRYHLFLEFYATGNIILTDNDLNVLALFRIVPEGIDQEELRVGVRYLLSNRQNINGIPALTDKRLRDSLQKAVVTVDADMNTRGKGSKNKSNHTLSKALATFLKEFSPTLIDHALRTFNFDSHTKVNDILADEALFRRLMLALAEAQKVIDGIMKCNSPQGYIIAKPRKPTTPTLEKEISGGSNTLLAKNESLSYEEYHPFVPRQYEDNSEAKLVELHGFNKTVDEFYSTIEVQHVQSRLSERDENAKRKLEAAKQDHEKRVDGLQQTQEIYYQKAQALEANLQSVQEAIAAINGLIAQGMGWVEIERLIEMEQAKNNIIAKMIKLPLKLYENTATLLLTRPSYDDEDDFVGDESDSNISESEDDKARMKRASRRGNISESMLVVDVNLDLSPWSNARRYYDQKKTAAIKEQKTLQSSAKALKNTERKISADLTKALKQEKEVLRPVRMPLWFEKFLFFISSEGYLVLGGRDAQQNDILYKRYLKRGDAYVHADLQGAASVIVKNRTGLAQSPIPPSTLAEAGTLAVVTSSAWDSKAMMSAWWVSAEQVSKTSPKGEYLPSGVFSILGQKTFLPPTHLFLGFGVMFQVSDESKARHSKNRILDQTVSKDIVVGASQDLAGAQPSPRENPNPFQVNALLPKGRDAANASTKFLIPALETITLASNVQGKLLEERGLDVDREEFEKETKSSFQLLNIDQCPPVDNPDTGKESNELETDLFFTSQRAEAGQPSALPSSVSSGGTTTTGLNSVSVKLKPQIRGKRGKFKKAKERYGDQDEEDRRAALQLLGSVAAQDKLEQDALVRAAREQESEAQKQRRRQQMNLAARKGKETEQLRQVRFQAELDRSDNEDLEGVDLETFVGTLLPGDEVLDALVVCGPWNAVGTRCRWKAKLQPGPTKKGKIIREILAQWSSQVKDQNKEAQPYRLDADYIITNEDSTKLREWELLKSFKEQEIVGAVPVSQCRVVVSGAKTGEAKGKGRGMSNKHPINGKQ